MFLDGHQPVKYGLRLEMDEKYQQLKEELADLCNVPASRLLIVEVYASNIRVSGGWGWWEGLLIISTFCLLPSPSLSPSLSPPSPLQNWPSDTTKIRSVLGGWLYAYELPPSSLLPPTRRSDSPDEILRKHQLQKVKRERTLSLQKAEESRAKAAKVREKLTREALRGRPKSEGAEEGAELEEEEGKEGTSPKRRKIVIDVVEQGQSLEVGGASEAVDGSARVEERSAVPLPEGAGGVSGEEHMELEDSDEVCNMSFDPHLSSGSGGSGMFQETYMFAVHRRLVSVSRQGAGPVTADDGISRKIL